MRVPPAKLRVGWGLCIVVACGCSSDRPQPVTPVDRWELAAHSSKTTDAWTPLVSVTAANRVRLYPGTPLEAQAFMRGRPEYEFSLRGERIVDGTGKVIVACSDGVIRSNDEQVARLTEHGFTSDTLTVTIAPSGLAGIVRTDRADDSQQVRFTAGIDPCTAALLYFSIAVPRAG